jgi:phosphoglycerate dehydrogenase-like enzyme
MPTVTVLDDYQRVAMDSADWSAVGQVFGIQVLDEHIADRDQLITALAGSEVVVAMRERTPFPAEVLRALPQLRLLITTGMTNASIDLAAAGDLGITVCGTDSSGNAVAELTIGMMIALTRHFVSEDAAIRSGAWQHTIGPELGGKSLGVVGLGRLGVPVTKLAQAFGMRVLAWSPNLTHERAAEHAVEAVGKRELFERSDIVTVHMPLSMRSRGLIGVDELAAMRPTSYLINTSRGPIIDEAALLLALRERRIAGAALDVYDVEPLPVDHPLRSTPNTLLLPHIGYVTTDTYSVWFAHVVENILAWHDGHPIRVLA